MEAELKRKEEQIKALEEESRREEERQKEIARLEAEKKKQAQAEAQAKKDPPTQKPEIKTEPKTETKPIETKPEPPPKDPEPTISEPEADPAPTVRKRPDPPEEGELVELDEWVNIPETEDPPKTQEIPSKAVKSGQYRPGQQIIFIVKVLVNERGKVLDTEILKSPIPTGMDDYGMTEDAIKYARKTRWKPGTKLGVKISIWTTQAIIFRAF